MHKFRSRVSVVLILLLVGSILPAFFLGEPNSHPYLAYAILGMTLVGVLGIFFSMRYVIEDDKLIIKMRPFRSSEIDIKAIEKIERSYNPLSSPAASFKRLYIKAGRNETLISPTDEAEFIRVLKARNPAMEVKIEDKEGWWRFWDWDV